MCQTALPWKTTAPWAIAYVSSWPEQMCVPTIRSCENGLFFILFFYFQKIEIFPLSHKNRVKKTRSSLHVATWGSEHGKRETRCRDCGGGSHLRVVCLTLPGPGGKSSCLTGYCALIRSMAIPTQSRLVGLFKLPSFLRWLQSDIRLSSTRLRGLLFYDTFWLIATWPFPWTQARVLHQHNIHVWWWKR